MNLNKVILVGRVTRDPELKTIPSGQNVAQFGLATNRVWNNQAGQKQEATEFHNIVAWRRLAEICAQYLKKGSLVLIEGRMQTRSWQGQDGVTKYRTEVVAENIQMGPRSSNQGGGYPPAPNTPATPATDGANSVSANNAPAENLETINLDSEGNPIEDSQAAVDDADLKDSSSNPGEPPSTMMPF